MDIRVDEKLTEETDLLVLGLCEGDKDYYKSIDKDLADELERVIKAKIFSSKFGSIYTTWLKNKLRVLILGVGTEKEFSIERLRRALARAVKYAKGNNIERFSTNLVSYFFQRKAEDERLIGRGAAEGIILASYSFDKYLTPKEEKKPLSTIFIQWKKEKKSFELGLCEGTIIAESTNYVRDLVNEPSILVTTDYLAAQAQAIAKTFKKTVSVRVLGRKELEKEGCNAILAVGKGSIQEPKLVILEYKGGNKGDQSTAIVGKGITFDTGGYNIKLTGYIETMKTDMAGAAIVLGTIKCLAKLNVKKNVCGVFATCENAVSGSSYKPGDIIRAYNKKTIEITNTDAEGRVVLADALAYTEKNYKPKQIIDLATLTGACFVALGNQISGAISTNKDLLRNLQKAGEESYDRLWELPLLDEYMDGMDSTVADVKNSEPIKYGAGTIMGAVFLKQFVEKVPWAHLDIAGTTFLQEEKEYLPKGATGAGTRLLLYYLLR